VARRGPAWLQSLPQEAYLRHQSYAGDDVLLQLTFLNSAGVPATPNSIVYEVDSLTTATNVIPSTSVSPITGSTQTIQLPGSLMQNTRPYLGEEQMQVWIQANIPDTNASSGSINKNLIIIIELVAVALPPE
jgi:hypothetical protein